MLGIRAVLAIRQGPNQRWSLDFLGDALSDSRRFRILAVVDDFTRACLSLVADTSLPGLRVVGKLEAILCERGKLTFRESILDADLPPQGVKIARRVTETVVSVLHGRETEGASTQRQPDFSTWTIPPITRRSSAFGMPRGSVTRCGTSHPNRVSSSQK